MGSDANSALDPDWDEASEVPSLGAQPEMFMIHVTVMSAANVREEIGIGCTIDMGLGQTALRLAFTMPYIVRRMSLRSSAGVHAGSANGSDVVCRSISVSANC